MTRASLKNSLVSGRSFTRRGKASGRGGPAPGHSAKLPAAAILIAALAVFLPAWACAQKTVWRQATAAELAAVLPSRAPVGSEHIETEMRTASGIVDNHGRYIAGVVMITAGYSAEGKYSHFLVVQVPVRIGGVKLKPGEYVFGWTRAESGEALHVHINVATTEQLVGTTDAHWIASSARVESLRIWPPGEKALIQIGRFGIPFSVGGK